MEYFLGLDNRELDHDLVKCAKCQNLQFEKPDKPGDKYAWRCRSCGNVNENNKTFLLHGQATYDGGSPI